MAKINKHEVRKEFRLGITAQEKEEVNKDHLDKLNEVDAVAQQARDSAAGYRKTLKDLRAEERELRTTCESGKLQVLDVIECRNFGSGEIWWVLKSTGKEIPGYRRQMTAEDDQVPLPDAGSDEDPDEA